MEFHVLLHQNKSQFHVSLKNKEAISAVLYDCTEILSSTMKQNCCIKLMLDLKYYFKKVGLIYSYKQFLLIIHHINQDFFVCEIFV